MPRTPPIGALNSLYLNSNNIGLPIATYILGNPALVAPILVMQQAIFTPVGLTVLDVTTKGKVSIKEIAKQPLHQPLLIGSLLGIVVSAISAKSGWFPVPKFIFDPIDMIGDSAVPMILMAFGMSLHGHQAATAEGAIARPSSRSRSSRTSSCQLSRSCSPTS